MTAADSESGGILEFQAAMLADDELIAPARAAIEAGDSAEAAWLSALNAEIAGYETSDDEYFRGRAADLVDLRDRVLRNLSGADLDGGAAGRDPRRRRRDPDPLPGDRLVDGRRLALAGGSATSHVAMLARARGVPMVVGLGAIAFDGHAEAMVDGDSGAVVLSPGHSQRRYVEMRRAAQRRGRRAERPLSQRRRADLRRRARST